MATPPAVGHVVGRRVFLGGLLGALVVADFAVSPLGTAERSARPSGDGYVRYEDLYRSGDTLNDAIWRLPASTPAIITFPQGRFEFADFTNNSKMYYAGIGLPKWCRGIVGSGKGALGAEVGTIFSMKERSSTTASAVPPQDNVTPIPQYMMKASSPLHPMQFSDFHLEGTEQGHIFGGLQVFNAKPGTRFTDILVTGWAGDNGAPPGETFGLTSGGQRDIRFLRCEADGRREVGGQAFGAAGMTLQGTAQSEMRDCVSHYVRASPAVFYLAFDSRMVGCVFDASTVPATEGVGNGSAPAVNLERSGDISIIDCTLLGRLSTNGQGGVNISHSNDSATRVIEGESYSAVDGLLTVRNPTFNALWGNGMLYIQSFTPYGSGDTQTTPPRVLRSDGANLPYEWVHGTRQLIG